MTNTPLLTEHALATAEALAQALATTIAAHLAAAVAERGAALLAVSGGKSPAAVFDALAEAALPWEAITVTLVDERWVPAESADSNERLLRSRLLVGPAAAARWVPMKNAAKTAEAGQPEHEACLQSLDLPFDVVLLGMGEDGHTASLFTDTPELKHALDLEASALCCATQAPVAPHERLSLTLRALLSSRLLLLQIQGETKLAVYRQALGDGAIEAMPIRALLRQSAVPIEVWHAP